MSYERITVVGNIGSAELLQSSAGNRYFKLSIAVDRNQSGNAVWYTVLLFGGMVKDHERLIKLYTKGRLVLVEGRPQVEAYLKKDGTVGLDNTIVAISMPELLNSKS